MTQTQDLRQVWVDACVDRFVACGVSAEDALEVAVSLADSEAFSHGDNTAEWLLPKHAADEEISNWGD